MSKIVRLSAENFMRLEAVEIRPKGDALVVVGGNNAQGKSSVLNAIAAALAGKRAFPPKPVREGATKAEIVVETENLVVTRTITDASTALVVKPRDGAPVKGPQALLDSLTGSLTFDPLSFARMQPGEQAATLRQMLGLDFAELDATREGLYAGRTLVNRDAKQIKARLDAVPPVPADTPDTPPDLHDVQAEAKAAEEHNATVRSRAAELKTLRAHAKELNARITSLQADLAALVKQGKELAETVAADELIDTDAVWEKLHSVEVVAEHVRAKHSRAALAHELSEAEAKSRDYTVQIELVDEQKRTLIAEAKMPVDGLGFGEDGVTLNGLPFEQASDAEKLRASVGIGFAANPDLRVLLVRDGSLLDAGSMKLLAGLAAERDGMVWLERVGEGDECEVVIEAGRVKGGAE